MEPKSIVIFDAIGNCKAIAEIFKVETFYRIYIYIQATL